jgi:hypothetical protein
MLTVEPDAEPIIEKVIEPIIETVIDPVIYPFMEPVRLFSTFYNDPNYISGGRAKIPFYALKKKMN